MSYVITAFFGKYLFSDGKMGMMGCPNIYKSSVSLVPKTAYLIDSIGFMFTKCQNRKSFIYNKLRDFRESLTYPHNELMRLCLLRWQSERRSAVLRPRWRVGITFSFNPRFL